MEKKIVSRVFISVIKITTQTLHKFSENKYIIYFTVWLGLNIMYFKFSRYFEIEKKIIIKTAKHCNFIWFQYVIHCLFIVFYRMQYTILYSLLWMRSVWLSWLFHFQVGSDISFSCSFECGMQTYNNFRRNAGVIKTWLLQLVLIMCIDL